MSVSDTLQPPPTYAPVTDASQPRSIVTIAGNPYIPLRWQTNINGHGATDDATVTLPIRPGIDFSVELFQSGISAFQPVPVAIMAGYPPNPQPGSLDTSGMTTRFLGNADLYDAVVDGNEVTFSVRSLASGLVDTKLTSAPMTMTSVQFAQAVATQFGLSFYSVLAPGVSPITIQEMLGRDLVSGQSFNSIVYNMYPWQILLQCAQFDDADVWVDTNGVLNYCSPTVIQRNTIALPYGSLLVEPKLTHSLQYNKNIRVEVRTWSPKTRTSTVVRAEGDAINGITVATNTKVVTSTPTFGTPTVTSTSISPTGVVTSSSSTTTGGNFNTSTGSLKEASQQIYKIYRKNISPAQATALAQSLWRQYSAQEYAIEFAFMMTEALCAEVDITSLFAISGLPYANFNKAGTTNDGYYPRKMTETFDMASGGWSMSVQAISHVLAQGAV